MRFHQLAICTVTLVGVFALARDSWELTGTARTNDGATQTLERTLGPISATDVALDSFRATRLSDGRTDVEWRSRAVDHVVFRLYREQNGHRVRIFPSLDSKLAANAPGAASAPAGQSYTWWDRTAPRDGAVSYWLEDVNLKGQRRWHGPLVLVAREPRLP